MSSAGDGNSAAALEFCDASLRWRDRTVLDRISLRLEPGDTLAVVGPSGAGKSSLARMAAGLVAPTSGSVRVMGHPQMVFQDPQRSLDPTMTVAALVVEGLEIAGRETPPRWRRASWRRQRAEPWLRRMGLDLSLADRMPSDLSGGQRQRVALARAMAIEPALLIADEAVSALDFATGAEILALLASWQRQSGAACLLVSHHLGQAAAFAPRLAVLAAGRIVESGSAAELRAHGRHEVTRALMRAMPPWPPPLVANA